MMTNDNRVRRWSDRPVTVGVDGSRPSLTAVEWATHEALLRRTALRMVFVISPLESTMGAEQVLTEAVSVALRTRADVTVENVAVAGDVAQALIGQTETAGVLVLGVDAERRRSQHGVLGPIEERVAAQALCPTVWVPPRRTAVDDAQILALVSGDTAGMTALETAAAEAEVHGARLRVVINPSVHGASTALLDQTLAEIGQVHPKVTVAVEDHPGLSDEALVSWITDPAVNPRLALVVLSGPHANDPWSLRTGSLGPALAHNGVVAVMYVGTAAADSPQAPATDREPTLLAATAPAGG